MKQDPMPNHIQFREDDGSEPDLELQPKDEEIIAPKELPEHFHTTDKIEFRDLSKKKLYIHHTIVGTAAATATNYGVFWIAPFECTVVEIREVHQTAGNDAGAVSLQIEKLTGTQALDAGVACLATAFDLKGTANTVNTGTLTATLADLRLVRGNRLAMDDAGTLTAVANVTVIIEITF